MTITSPKIARVDRVRYFNITFIMYLLRVLSVGQHNKVIIINTMLECSMIATGHGIHGTVEA